MAESPDDIVGHKTLRDGDGLRHEPLTRREANEIRARADAAKARRAEAMPTAEAAAKAMWDAWYRLKELGWKDPRYAPADGRIKKIVEVGSSGLHDAHCVYRQDDRQDEKWWWIPADGYCPTSPVLYLPDEQEEADHRARMEEARQKWANRRSEESTGND